MTHNTTEEEAKREKKLIEKACKLQLIMSSLAEEVVVVLHIIIIRKLLLGLSVDRVGNGSFESAIRNMVRVMLKNNSNRSRNMERKNKCGTYLTTYYIDMFRILKLRSCSWMQFIFYYVFANQSKSFKSSLKSQRDKELCGHLWEIWIE